MDTASTSTIQFENPEGRHSHGASTAGSWNQPQQPNRPGAVTDYRHQRELAGLHRPVRAMSAASPIPCHAANLGSRPRQLCRGPRGGRRFCPCGKTDGSRIMGWSWRQYFIGSTGRPNAAAGTFSTGARRTRRTFVWWPDLLTNRGGDSARYCAANPNSATG